MDVAGRVAGGAGGSGLVASHPGNTSAVTHGAYAAGNRVLAPRAAEIAEALLQLPHVQPLDGPAAEEIGALVPRIEALDAALDKRQPTVEAPSRCWTCGCARAAGWSCGCGRVRRYPGRTGGVGGAAGPRRLGG